jgi:hypothetical protein
MSVLCNELDTEFVPRSGLFLVQAIGDVVSLESKLPDSDDWVVIGTLGSNTVSNLPVRYNVHNVVDGIIYRFKYRGQGRSSLVTVRADQ